MIINLKLYLEMATFIFKNSIKIAVCILLQFSLSLKAAGQSNQYDIPDFNIGKPIFDYTFHDVQNSSTNKIRLSDYKEKWLIIDFWSQNCTSCIKSFPELDTIQKKYAGKLKIISVGNNASNFGKPSYIKELFDRLNNRYKYSFSEAFDSTLAQSFKLEEIGFPYMVFIDPNGIIRYVTNSIKLRNVDRLLAGEDPMFSPLENRTPLNATKSDESKKESLCSIKLNRWQPGDRRYSLVPSLPFDSSSTSMLRIREEELADLFMYAYTGEEPFPMYQYPLRYDFYYWPILEFDDSSVLDFDKTFNCEIKLNKSVPKSEILKYLRLALEGSFPFVTTVEERNMPYWAVTLKDNSYASKLRSKGGPQSGSQPKGKFMDMSIKNVRPREIVAILWANFSIGTKGTEGLPFVDETGIDYNIDLDINGSTVDFENVKNEYERNGLLIQKKYRIVKCVVIRK